MKLVSLSADLRAKTGFDGFALDTIVQLTPRGEPYPVDFRVSDTFRVMWDVRGQRLKWDADFTAALPDLARIALGRFLDDYDVPVGPQANGFAMRVTVASDLFDIFTQRPATDEELRAYVRAKIHWGWKFQCEPTRFEAWDAHRLKVSVADIEHAAFPFNGELWTEESGAYRALPRFASELATVPVVAARSVAAGQGYDVALSFAGEQRAYVHDVATALRHGGINVFYDDFEDLWGKDLTKEFEAVFRRQSRFVVIFVSKEYLQKAWTNEERQHALAGRIERMDDSVLPVRFDRVELPGLPATVGYREVGTQTPQELAAAIMGKVRASADV